MKNKVDENIIVTEYSELMKQAYIDYAMSVIVSRAIPDVRDGLKPVQRRTLFDMNELGLSYDKPYKKCARVVGDTMGKYHPHGDSSIYESLVIMSQDFKKSVALVDGHGNFGSIEGDGAAAMRYTECRLQRVSQEALLGDLDKDVVDFVSNFDDSLLEPEVLPSRLPNILINGSEGIAVGMVTSIPTHNITESIDALIYKIRNEDASVSDLMKIVQGPDFPTGGCVINKSELAQIYTTGSGKIKLRGKAVIEADKAGKQKIVITQIPYTMIGAGINKFLMDVASLAESRQAPDISNISNQSSKDGIRIVIELKKGADAENILNLLYKKTKLEDSFSVNMLVVDGKKPVLMDLSRMLGAVARFQESIYTRKYRTLLKKEQDKAEIQEGLLKAVDVIDVIIAVLRGAKTVADVRNCFTTGNTERIQFRAGEYEEIAKGFSFTQKQATAILEMRMQKLVGLELEMLQKEYETSLVNIESYQELLSDKEKLKNKIISELNKLKKIYHKERRTVLTDVSSSEYLKPVVKEQEITVIIDKLGYIRALDRATYEKNLSSIADEIKFAQQSNTVSRIGIFTDSGKLHIIKCDELPLGKLREKGRALDTLSNMDSMNENIIYVADLNEVPDKEFLFVTEKSMLKRVSGTEFDVVSKRTVAATKLTEADRLVCILETDNRKNIVLRTSYDIFLRFNLSEVSLMKKNAVGVRGMRLERGDFIIGAYVFDPVEEEVTESLDSYPLFSPEKKTVQDKEIDIHLLSSLRLARRDTKGSRM